MRKLRIGIVNDVRLAQEVLKRFVNGIENFEIAWVAADGREAVEMTAKDVPDIILMDLIMPVMDGVKATHLIMKNSPCAILIVTASPVNNSSMIFEAMGYGALDVVMTPAITLSHDPQSEKNLYKKIETIAKLLGKVIPSEPAISKSVKGLTPPPPTKGNPPLVVIGSSTGGPFALSKILSQFPANTPCAFVVIQHVDQQFAQGFAEWLAGQIKLHVALAVNGDTVKAGTVLIAGKNDHLVMTSGLFLKYTPIPEENPYRPSVDVFFYSVAQNWPTPSIAVLLTGMGNDGARGMKALFDAGWNTIAEHEYSCVVYGMPKAAIELGAAKQVVVLDKIAQAVTSSLKFTK